jgi:hypothetical protein
MTARDVSVAKLRFALCLIMAAVCVAIIVRLPL